MQMQPASQPATISPLSRGRIGCRPNREKSGALWRFCTQHAKPKRLSIIDLTGTRLTAEWPNDDRCIRSWVFFSFFFSSPSATTTKKKVSQYRHSIEFDNDNRIRIGRWKWADFASNKRPHTIWESATGNFKSFPNLFETLFFPPIRSATAGQDRIHLCKGSTYIYKPIYYDAIIDIYIWYIYSYSGIWWRYINQFDRSL